MVTLNVMIFLLASCIFCNLASTAYELELREMLSSLKSEMVEMNQRVKAMNDKQDRIVGQLKKELKEKDEEIDKIKDVISQLQSPGRFADPQVAFYVRKTGPNQLTYGTIVYETVVTNVGGFWNRVGNTYVIPQAGMYVIHMGIKKHSSSYVHAGIMKDSEEIQRMETTHGNVPSGFTAAVVELHVNVQIYGRVYTGYLQGGPKGLNTLSGFMLYAL